MQQSIEYRVVPVTRFIVTRYESHSGASGPSGSVSERGEFNNFNNAYEVGRALAECERQSLGFALDDPRIKFPDVTSSS